MDVETDAVRGQATLADADAERGEFARCFGVDSIVAISYPHTGIFCGGGVVDTEGCGGADDGPFE